MLQFLLAIETMFELSVKEERDVFDKVNPEGYLVHCDCIPGVVGIGQEMLSQCDSSALFDIRTHLQVLLEGDSHGNEPVCEGGRTGLDVTI